MESGIVHIDGLKAEIEKALREMGVCNVLIAGRTGVGKSTLINSVFHGRMAATGQGKPVTTTARFTTVVVGDCHGSMLVGGVGLRGEPFDTVNHGVKAR